MAYYFKCESCGKGERFAYRDDNVEYHVDNHEYCNEGKKQEYETVICTNCISKKVRLKGNYIII